MNLTRKVTQLVLATAVIGGLALATVPAAVAGGGLRNCVDVTGSAINRVGCWEDVWSDGIQHRMTFSNTQYKGGDTTGVETPSTSSRRRPAWPRARSHSATTTSSATCRRATAAPTARSCAGTSCCAVSRASCPAAASRR